MRECSRSEKSSIRLSFYLSSVFCISSALRHTFELFCTVSLPPQIIQFSNFLSFFLSSLIFWLLFLLLPFHVFFFVIFFASFLSSHFTRYFSVLSWIVVFIGSASFLCIPSFSFNVPSMFASSLLSLSLLLMHFVFPSFCFSVLSIPHVLSPPMCMCRTSAVLPCKHASTRRHSLLLLCPSGLYQKCIILSDFRTKTFVSHLSKPKLNHFTTFVRIFTFSQKDRDDDGHSLQDKRSLVQISH